MTKDTSGPAFPQQISLEDGNGHHLLGFKGGLTKREWFAGQALSSEAMFRAYNQTPELMAKYAFAIAVAMLAEGEK